MAYWGCSTYPNRFLSSTIKIRKALSSWGLSGSLSIDNKTTIAQSSFSISTINKVDATEQIVTAHSVTGVSTTAEQIFARIAYSEGGGIASIGYSEPHQKYTAMNEMGVVGTGHLQKYLNRTAASVCVPVAIVNDTYYWQCYEEVESEDNDSVVE